MKALLILVVLLGCAYLGAWAADNPWIFDIFENKRNKDD